MSDALGPPSFDEATLIRRAYEGDPGVMIDVGAHVGGTCIPYATRGWQVHCLEPDGTNRAALIENLQIRGLDHVIVDPRAASDVGGETLTFYRSEVSSGISSLRPFHESHVEGDRVTTVTLDAYLEEHGVDSVDFLKIDTEGADLLVLRGFPWDRILPTVILCEFEDAKTRSFDYVLRDLVAFLTARGYHLLVSEWEPITAYGSDHTWVDLHDADEQLSNDTAWGNVIAARDSNTLDAIRSGLDREVARVSRRAAVERLRRRLSRVAG